MQKPTVSASLALVTLLGVGVVAACSETVPSATSAPPDATDGGAAPPFAARPVRPQCAPYVAPILAARVSFERLTPDKLFENPVDIVVNAGRTYVAEQLGKLRRLAADGQSATTVIDLSAQAVTGGEAGLLGVAFHPAFSQNGFVYLSYTAPHPQQPPPAGVVFQSVIARFHSSDGGATLEPASEKRILVLDQPFSNHNGGKIVFGADGMLYAGFGDGGGGGDPAGNGQNKATLLGAMLRLDVDGGDPYAIPPTNPFAGGGGAPEIYAYGFRNPWRFSFDAATGDLWVGDVGQGAREEIDKVVLGGNYGWNVREGKTCYNAATCDATGLIDPIVDYGRNQGGSVTGGVVYRGTRVPELTGKYVYGDFSTGAMWSIPANEAVPAPVRLDDGLPRTNPSVFAIAADGEVIFADYASGTLQRLGPPQDPASSLPASLSATGCVEASDPLKAGAGLVPYDVRVPQWADGATAQRYLSLPDGSKVGILAGGRLVLPPRSVALRLVSRERRLVEAQIIERGEDRSWRFYAYAWNDGTGDATLVPSAGARVRLPSGAEHVIASREQCAACHNEGAGVTLGLEVAQLDRQVDYPSGPADQLAALAAVGILAPLDPAVAYPRLPLTDGVDLTEPRARAYLHVNCASCHRGGEGKFDLRYTTPLRDAAVCDVGARIVPGNPNGSLVLSTLRATGDGRMPPFATLVPDAAGARVVEDWIRLLSACP